MAKQSAGEKRQGEESAVKEVISWVVTIVLAVAAALVIKNYVIINANIPSGSMENTIMTDDRLFGNRLAYNKNRTPQRGDIIIFKFPDDESENFIKRVIGLPGETVQIKGETIYINGKPLKEDYGKDPITDAGIAEEPITLGDDEYFMLGDNRGNSTDSRDPSVGCVKRDWIVGKVSFRIYPFDSIGKIN